MVVGGWLLVRAVATSLVAARSTSSSANLSATKRHLAARFVAHLSTQQLCHAKRYEFEGVRPWVTDEALGSSETRDGRE